MSVEGSAWQMRVGRGKGTDFKGDAASSNLRKYRERSRSQYIEGCLFQRLGVTTKGIITHSSAEQTCRLNLHSPGPSIGEK